MRVRVNDRRVFVSVMIALVVTCWLALSLWSLSPYAPFLSHEVLETVHHATTPNYLLLLLVFVVGWVLMTIAMMLPTSLPLIAMFHRLTRSHRNRTQLVTVLIAGYLLIWMIFGIVAHLGDLLVHRMVHQIGWLEAHPWVISAVTFAAAGIYQFTPLKYMCLDRCRSPLSFITEHWHGHHEQQQALQLGVHHGLFCLGCCWSLMLLMFAVGVGNLGWMLLLGALMAYEKNMPSGRRLSKPLGILSLGTSFLLIFMGAS